MAYCTYAQVVYATGTSKAQATVEALIDLADLEINAKLAEQDISAPASNDYLKTASIKLTTVWLIRRGLMDLSRPESLTMGPTSWGVGDQSSDIEMLTKEAYALVDTYINSVNDPDSTSDAEVEETIVREDHQMPTMNLDQGGSPEYHDKADDIGHQDTDNGEV